MSDVHSTWRDGQQRSGDTLTSDLRCFNQKPHILLLNTPLLNILLLNIHILQEEHAQHVLLAYLLASDASNRGVGVTEVSRESGNSTFLYPSLAPSYNRVSQMRNPGTASTLQLLTSLTTNLTSLTTNLTSARSSAA